MPKRTQRQDDAAGGIRISTGGAFIDNSHGKRVTVGAEDKAVSADGFLSFALKRLPLLVWAVGAGAIVAVVAIVYRFHLPAVTAIFGPVAIVLGMFVLVLFAGLVQPPKVRKPPLPARVALWAVTIILIAILLLTVASVFFDWPVHLRSLIVRVPTSQPAAATTP